MANRYTIGSGDASNPAVWDGGATVPGTGDRVLIMAGHTITVTDTREWGNDSTATITVNGVSTTYSVHVAGTLAFSDAANSQLTINGSIGFVATGTLQMGTQATPIPVAYTAKLLLNKSAALADRKYGIYFVSGSKFSIWGATKRRFTSLASNVSAGAGSITVADATGWRVGDEIYLASTGVDDTQEHEMFFIHSSYTNGSTTVPLANSGGTAVNTAFAHLAPAPVGNLTSNVNVTAHNKTYRPIGLVTNGSACLANNRSMGYCTIEAFGRWDDQTGWTWVNDANYTANPWKMAVSGVTGVAFVSRTSDSPLYHQLDVNDIPARYYDSFFIAVATGQYAVPARLTGYSAFDNCLFGGAYMQVETKEKTVFNACFFAQQSKQSFIVGNSRGVELINCRYSGQHESGAIAACPVGGTGPTDMLVSNCDVTETFPARNKPDAAFSSSVFGGGLTVTCKDTYFGTCPAMDFARIPSMTSVSYVKIVNKNRDVTLQEEWVRTGVIERENTIKRRSTSSMRMKPSVANTALKKTMTISVANGETLRIVGYCRYDTTYYNGGTGFSAPTMTLGGTINGVALAPVTYTAASANAGNWDFIDKSITNTSGGPGEITVTFSAQTPVVNGLAYFDGIVLSPLVVTARHYGFVFDDANPKRIVNPIVTASESTAYAYTGVTINSATPQITVGAGTANTFKKVYDYIQAWACVNLDKTVLLTSNDGSNFSVPTTCKVSWPGMGTDGTLSGGWLLLGAPGTINHKLSGTKIDFTAAGTYNMGGSTFGGTVELVNSSGGSVTVALPTGTSYTNTGPNITVTTPQPTLTITDFPAGADVVVLQAGTSTVLASVDANPTTSWGYAYSTLQNVDIGVILPGYVPKYVRNYALQATSTSLPIPLSADRNYS